MYNVPDIDIDVSKNTRQDMLCKLKHIKASKITDNIYPHNVGVYFCNIPKDEITGLASIDYKKAETDYGYVKIDILHNSIYDEVISRDEIRNIDDNEIDWNGLYNKDIFEHLPQIYNYYGLLNMLPKIDSVEKLAMFISIIRPAKKYLIDEIKNNSWESIKDRIWIKEENGYMYKKSHAIAFSLSIIVVLNRLLKLGV